MSSNDEIADRGDSGSESDRASLGDVNLTGFLSNASPIDGLSFPTASGIDAGRVAQAVIGTIAFTAAYGFNTFIQAAASAPTRIIDATGDFIADGLIASTVGVAASAIEGAWSFSVAEFGPLAYVVALLSVVATFYVAEWGVQTAREVL